MASRRRQGQRLLERVQSYAFLAAILLPSASVADSFVAFESGQVRPLALSVDRNRLFAVNTPDNRLEIFRVLPSGIVAEASVPVGLEPVAVALRDDQVWVVNHLSDSVSIIDVGMSPPRVVRTLLVGDEPRDIVFAGPNRRKAFITTAHRGQNSPIDPELATPGVGRADVWVFDVERLGPALGGAPTTIVTLFGDTPRALAATPDGNTVYAAVFHSGNQTTVVNEHVVCDGGETATCELDGIQLPGGLPAPTSNVEGIQQPEVGLIVKFNPGSGTWEDELGRDWSAAVRFDLPDYDVFAIDAARDAPAEVARYSGVGTILFNMAVNPVSGVVYVSNTEARNEVRFEGPGILAGSSVRGHLHEARITVIDPLTGAVTPHRLNPHIDYDVVPSPPGIRERSLATPLELATSKDGKTLYVAALGSSKIGVIDTAALEAGTFLPDPRDHIEVSGGGPTGLVFEEDESRLFVLTRFDNAVSVIDTARRIEIDHVTMHNPEPAEIVDGRRFLYDATLTSSNGEASCSSCHVFADVDDLAWDLGNPDEKITRADFRTFHPMKGPMTVQTLRGIATHGPLHWRGDRNGAIGGGDPLDERAAFRQFNDAFVNLLGREKELTDEEMESYTDFVMQILPPPNPIRALDNSLTPRQVQGKDAFEHGIFCGSICHDLDPSQGFFGSNGQITIALETQDFKVPHLRNLYTRVGMFGMPPTAMFGGNFDNGYMGDQIRGFGFIHDGSVDTLVRFLRVSIFSFQNDEARRPVEEFLLAFDSNLAPVVGQQVTLSDGSDQEAISRVDLFEARAEAGECDLTVAAVLSGELRGWYLTPTHTFRSDRISEPEVEPSELIDVATPDTPVTYTCVPPGSGVRIGVDRDGDGFLNRDELDACSDSTNPSITPDLVEPCTGDCDHSCAVSIDELVQGVHIALGDAEVARCRALDQDGNGHVSVDEIVLALSSALHGCGHPASGRGLAP